MFNIFIRHGEVQNPSEINYSDIPGFSLSEKGSQQAEQAGNYLKSIGKDLDIISSPILRARQTAEIISNVLKTNFTTDKSLYEWRCPPSWVGRKFKDLDKEDLLIRNYKDIPLQLKGGAESFKKTSERMKDIDNQYENKIFISHQDAIRSYTFFTLDNQSLQFHQDKPAHCEIQQITENQHGLKEIEKLFIPK